MVEIVLAALLLAAVGVGVLLAIPVSLVLDAEWTETPDLKAHGQFTWLFGLVHVRFGQTGGLEASHTGQSPVQTARTKRKTLRTRRRRHHPVTVGRALLQTQGFTRRVLRLLNDLRRGVRLDDVRARTTIGLEDPADTGRLYATLAPVCVAANLAGCDVRCDPDFLQERFAGSCHGRVALRPLRVVGTLGAFICSPTTIRAAWAVWVARRAT